MRITNAVVATIALFTVSGCSMQTRQQPLADAPTADIQITSSPNTSVLVYATTPARFALRGEELRMRSDTIRVTTPANVTAYLNSSDIHIAAGESVPVKVEATIAHAPATHAAATGPHVVLYAGGIGIGPTR